MLERRGADDGFTIIELLIVVTIIAILAALAIPNYMLFKEGAFNRSAESDVRNIAPAAEIAFSNIKGTQIFSLTGSGGKLAPDLSGATHTVGVTGLVSVNGDDGTYIIQAEHLRGTVCYTFDSEVGWTYNAVCPPGP